MREILIADCDVIINLFDILRKSNYKHFERALTELGIRYYQVWIPEEVEKEFTSHPKEKDRRKRTLRKIYKKFQFIVKCPITITERQIVIDNGNADENRGETDAMLQCTTAMSKPTSKYRFSNIYMFFRDRGAIKRAKFKNLDILPYDEFAIGLREIG